MSPELEAKLEGRFPALLTGCRGLAVGDGWFDLLWGYLLKVEAHLAANPGHTYSLNHAKEKWGQLRLDTDDSMGVGGSGFHPDINLQDLADDVEALSFGVCEDCGTTYEVLPAAKCGQGWLKTLCVPCWDIQCDAGGRPRFAAVRLREIE